MKSPSFENESFYWKQNLSVAGIDEVGKGSFAGPVVAAAVIFPNNFVSHNKLFSQINDSKLLHARKRKLIAEFIKSICTYSIAEIGVKTINVHGIGKSTTLAMLQAINMLSLKPDASLIDGYVPKGFSPPHKGIVKGDRLSISIAAASIIAKVYRDSLMEKLHIKYKDYDFHANKGYGTKKHREMLKMYGLCPHHRTSFNLKKHLVQT